MCYYNVKLNSLSRVVEGRGPMKPGSLIYSRCQIPRRIPIDEAIHNDMHLFFGRGLLLFGVSIIIVMIKERKKI